jgi:pimeloyl-ACP methyl ester carboxylesterase
MALQSIQRAGAKIVYEVRGSGPPLILLHPFPTNRHFWDSVSPSLESRYRLIVPELRGHGESSVGEGASMANYAEDVFQICHECGITRAAFVGVSIGGYLLFEFWRKYRDVVALLTLSNTRAQADSGEARANRLKAADEVEKNGTSSFLDSMVPKLLGETTRRNRPDIVDRARAMMDAMSRQGLAAVQRGMAARPDSVATLPTINVPTLVVRGQEDTLIPAQDVELMHDRISGSQLVAIPESGHYAPLEKPDEFLKVLRPFLDGRSW